MLDWQTIITMVSLAGGVCGIVFGVLNSRRASRTEEKKAGKQDGIILTELGYVKSGIDDIKRKQDRQETQHVEVVTRLTAVEQASKQAHKRIDRLEGAID